MAPRFEPLDGRTLAERARAGDLPGGVWRRDETQQVSRTVDAVGLVRHLRKRALLMVALGALVTGGVVIGGSILLALLHPAAPSRPWVAGGASAALACLATALAFVPMTPEVGAPPASLTRLATAGGSRRSGPRGRYEPMLHATTGARAVASIVLLLAVGTAFAAALVPEVGMGCALATSLALGTARLLDDVAALRARTRRRRRKRQARL